MRVDRVVAPLSLIVLFTSPAFAADGDLDPNFGKGGKVFTSFGYPAQAGTAMALDPDGRIVVAGFTFDNTANVDFGVARYLPDGSIDTTFGSGGFVATDFFGGEDLPRGVAIQPDGRIVVAGSATQGSNLDFALARYNADGTLDSSFDGDGRLTTDFFGPSGSGDIASAVSIQPDGNIVIAGSALVRYTPSGALDTTFGAGGFVSTTVFGEGFGAFALALQSDRKIVVVGAFAQTGSPTSDDWLLARFDSDGKPDVTFGSAGSVKTDFFGRGDAARALLLRPDGKIVVAGTAGHPSAPGAVFAVARYLENGLLDLTFDGDGRQTSDFDGFDEVAFSVAAQSDGKLVLGGYAANPDFTLDFALVRYNANGSEDTSFGNLGRVRTDFFGGSDGASAIAVQADDKIVAAGSASFGGFFALARYLGGPAPVAPSCPHSAGFWKSHRSEWPAASLTLGSESYSGDELAALLTKPVRGDASVLLARELIAAKFNAASGAESEDLATEIGAADRLLTGLAGRLPLGVSPSSPLAHSMLVSAGRLASLNNRRSSPECVASK
jgi:uncharacterized delta-60 repeat protein